MWFKRNNLLSVGQRNTEKAVTSVSKKKVIMVSSIGGQNDGNFFLFNEWDLNFILNYSLM
jgi:chemotaxis receptor (MCP) glutamine deamidase CheD